MKTSQSKQKPSRPKVKEESGSLVSARSRQRTALSPPRRQPPRRKKKTTKRALLQCPKCNIALHQRTFQDVPIDECPACHGLWLDKGELAQASRTVGEKWIGQFFVDLAKLMENPAPFHEEKEKRAGS